MFPKIGVSALKSIHITYEGDLYDLACMLLKIHDARAQGTQSRSRTTVKGLITKYAMLANVDFSQVEGVVGKHHLPLGATVEHDEDVSGETI